MKSGPETDQANSDNHESDIWLQLAQSAGCCCTKVYNMETAWWYFYRLGVLPDRQPISGVNVTTNKSYIFIITYDVNSTRKNDINQFKHDCYFSVCVTYINFWIYCKSIHVIVTRIFRSAAVDANYAGITTLVVWSV